MAPPKGKSSFLENTLLPAILLSLGVHVLFISILHPFQPVTHKTLPILEIILDQPKKPEPTHPAPVPIEPAKPEPPKPRPKKTTPPPEAKTPPSPTNTPVIKDIPSPPVVAPPAPTQTVPEVIAAAPAKTGESTFVAPTATTSSEKSNAPSQEDIDADFSKYRNLLGQEFAKHKQYPRIAQLRGWQGTVHIRLEVDTNGGVISSSISQSSGHESLDQQALEMVKKASPLPLPPETLRKRPFTVTVPILFRLE